MCVIVLSDFCQRPIVQGRHKDPAGAKEGEAGRDRLVLNHDYFPTFVQLSGIKLDVDRRVGNPFTDLNG
jgi:hypothetical protein